MKNDVTMADVTARQLCATPHKGLMTTTISAALVEVALLTLGSPNDCRPEAHPGPATFLLLWPVLTARTQPAPRRGKMGQNKGHGCSSRYRRRNSGQ